MFPSSTKREIRHFHVAVVHRQQRNDKKRDHVQSCCFANINLLLCFRSLCRRYCHCLSSPLTARGGGVVAGGGGEWLFVVMGDGERALTSHANSPNSSKNIIIISINVIIIFFFITISYHHHHHHRHRHHQAHLESLEDLSDWYPVHNQCA